MKLYDAIGRLCLGKPLNLGYILEHDGSNKKKMNWEWKDLKYGGLRFLELLILVFLTSLILIFWLKFPMLN